MEQADQELLQTVITSDNKLKRLYDKHRKLEKEVENLERYKSYSSSAALRQRELKKQKLSGMEEIMDRLSSYRSDPSNMNV